MGADVVLNSDLSKIHERIRRRSFDLERALLHTIGGADDPTLTHVIVEIDNIYIEGLRAVTMASMGDAKLRSGGRSKPTQRFRTQGEAGAFLLATLNPRAYQNKGSPHSVDRRLEPTIRRPSDVVRVLSQLQTRNISSVRSAAAYPATFLDLLPTFRNFFAHRNQDTTMKVKNKIRNLGIPANDHPAKLLFKPIPDRPVRVCEDWFNELRGFFDVITW